MKYFVATVPPEQLQDICLVLRFHKAGRSCSPRLEKRSLFSPPLPCAKNMAQGFRCLRAAIRAARPHLDSIFEKLLHRKTFQLPAARILHPLSPQIPSSPIMPTFFVKYLTNIPESSIIRESVFFAGFGKSTAALTTFDSRGKDAGFL